VQVRGADKVMCHLMFGVLCITALQLLTSRKVRRQPLTVWLRRDSRCHEARRTNPRPRHT
jgi:hypothetical protein